MLLFCDEWRLIPTKIPTLILREILSSHSRVIWVDRDNTRDRKREASAPVDEPDGKKPRLDSKEVVRDAEREESMPLSEKTDDAIEDNAVENADEDSGNAKPSGTASKRKSKGDGGFKEHPYTFLLPNDPILQSCL